MADYVVMVYPAIADLTQSCGWTVEQEYLAVQLYVGLLLGCRMMVVALFSCSGGVLVLVGRIDCGGWNLALGMRLVEDCLGR